MPYRYLDNVATADIAFEATGPTLEDMFQSAADALLNIMVENIDRVESREKKMFVAEDERIDMLLFQFLQEIVYWKDAENLLLRAGHVEISSEKGLYALQAVFEGERFDKEKHRFLIDVKAVTLHRLEVAPDQSGWKGCIVVDV